ncbi:hypothetical protein ACLOJK_006594 [Asimina triloba]
MYMHDPHTLIMMRIMEWWWEASLHNSFCKGEGERGREEEKEEKALFRKAVLGAKAKDLGVLLFEYVYNAFMLFIKRSPHYTVVPGCIVVTEELVSRGYVLTGSFGAFRPDETFSASFLFPCVLYDLYRGLNEVVYHERGPGRAVTYYPSHFFFERLGTYFAFFGYDEGVSEHRVLPEQRLYAFKPWDSSLPYYYRSHRGWEVMMGAESGTEMTSPAHILWVDLFRAPEHRLLFDNPLVEEVEFQMREPGPQSCVSPAWSGDDDEVRAEEVIFVEEGSHFSLIGIAQCPGQVVRSAADPYPLESERVPESPIDLSDSSEETHLEDDNETASGTSPGRGLDEASQEAIPTADVVEEALIGHMSPIGNTGGGGSARSVGKASVTVGRAVTALISESVFNVGFGEKRQGGVLSRRIYDRKLVKSKTRLDQFDMDLRI